MCNMWHVIDAPCSQSMFRGIEMQPHDRMGAEHDEVRSCNRV